MFRLAIATLLAALVVPSAAFAQKVNTDFDSSVDFSRFKTYSWTEGTPSPNPLGEERIREAVDAHMVKAGFTKVAADSDVVIATHLMTQEQKEVVSTGYGVGYPYRYGWGAMGGGMTTASVNTYIQGTLILDMYDRSSKKLAWRGSGTDTASDKADKNTKKVNKALDKMFKAYPPKVKTKT